MEKCKYINNKQGNIYHIYFWLSFKKYIFFITGIESNKYTMLNLVYIIEGWLKTNKV